MNKLNIQEEPKLNKYNVKVYWSDDNTGDCYESFDLEGLNEDQIWDIIFTDYYKPEVKQKGTFEGDGLFMWYEYYSKSSDMMVLYEDLEESDKEYNEYEELETYSQCWSIQVTKEDD